MSLVASSLATDLNNFLNYWIRVRMLILPARSVFSLGMSDLNIVFIGCSPDTKWAYSFALNRVVLRLLAYSFI